MTRTSLALTLAAISLPVLAASTIGSKCESRQSNDEPVVRIDTRIDSDLKVLRTDANKSASVQKLDELINSSFTAAPELAAGRQQALADALERRQRQKLALPPKAAAADDDGVPQVETRLPGVSIEDSLIYRREMYRTDI